MSDYPHVSSLKTAADFRARAAALGIRLPLDDAIIPAPAGPLAQPYRLANGRVIGNRFCAQPMEGWDGTADGFPSDLTRRRWENFGRSGAKLIWGGEAVAVRHDGRANPRQLIIDARTLPALADLRAALIRSHIDRFGAADDLLIGLQLTHSGRFSKPNDNTRFESKILYRHPALDPLFKLPTDHPIMTDAEIDDLIGDFVRAARQARELGFDFVDIKHCHGYLGHEFLSAVTRPGAYGGSFENRTRFLREIARGIALYAPGLLVGVRLSLFDTIPFRPGPDGVGRPRDYRNADGRYPYAFGADPLDPLRIDLAEPFAFLRLLLDLGVELVNLTAGSPYYCPHIQRPASYPPSDGYRLVEDPLVGVARLVDATAQAKAALPQLAMVGTGYSYLQEWLPHVAQAVVSAGMADFAGLGRSILSYPELAGDVLAGCALDRKRICRTFSDCTTAPRRGLVSGCYPLDPFYKTSPQAETLREAKRGR